MKYPPDLVLPALAHVATGILPRYFTPDCCIAASRVGQRVLQRFGIAAHGLVVNPLIVNPAYLAWFKLGGEGEMPADARVLLIDLAKDGPKFPGHVVLVGRARRNNFLLDLSARQFDRLEKGISVPRAIYLPRGDRPFVPVMIGLPGGGAIQYDAHPDPTLGFEDAPDWRVDDPETVQEFESVTRDLIAAVLEVFGPPRQAYAVQPQGAKT